MRFTSGCCSVSETPLVCAWKRISHERGCFAPNRSRIARAQMRRAARNFATSSKRSLWQLKKKLMRGANSSMSSPRPSRPAHVLEAVCQRERQFLRGRRPRLADVVAADADRVPLRHLARGELDRVDHEPHGVLGREDELVLRDELLEDVVLQRARQRRARDAALLGRGDEHRVQHGRRAVDRHRRRQLAEGEIGEEDLHVGERDRRRRRRCRTRPATRGRRGRSP